jgi:hypothetical protein
MKKILPLLTLIVAATIAHAQSFEGTIRWSMTLRVSEEEQKQMDKMAKTLGGNGFLPTDITLKQKGQWSVASLHGSFMGDIDNLYLGDKKERYEVMHKMKSYKMLKPGVKERPESPKITKTNETATIAGYNCTKYVVVTAATVTTSYWATTELSGVDVDWMYAMSNSAAAFIYPEIEGIPMKMEMIQPKQTVVVEVVEVSKEPLPDSVFQIPSDYKNTSR